MLPVSDLTIESPEKDFHPAFLSVQQYKEVFFSFNLTT